MAQVPPSAKVTRETFKVKKVLLFIFFLLSSFFPPELALHNYITLLHAVLIKMYLNKEAWCGILGCSF